MVDQVKITLKVNDSESNSDLSMVKILRVDLDIVAKAQHESHRQFRSNMGLGDFAALDWGCKTEMVIECRKFVWNYNKEYTTAQGCPIDLSESSLVTIFKLGKAKNRQAALREKQWQS
ncbi:unnamed protein product [Calypogeia fissa]